MNNTNTNASNPSAQQGIGRLLQSIKCLGEENALLLRRLEHEGFLERENLRLRAEMADFKAVS
jgi:hypothetical protein